MVEQFDNESLWHFPLVPLDDEGPIRTLDFIDVMTAQLEHVAGIAGVCHAACLSGEASVKDVSSTLRLLREELRLMDVVFHRWRGVRNAALTCKGNQAAQSNGEEGVA